MFKNKNVLVAGGTGLVGIQLIKILNKLGANIYVASLDKNLFKKNEIKKFFKLDLKNIDNCLKITKKIDIVFNLLGVTGSPQTNIRRPRVDRRLGGDHPGEVSLRGRRDARVALGLPQVIFALEVRHHRSRENDKLLRQWR